MLHAAAAAAAAGAQHGTAESARVLGVGGVACKIILYWISVRSVDRGGWYGGVALFPPHRKKNAKGLVFELLCFVHS